jgi:galactose oxidase
VDHFIGDPTFTTFYSTLNLANDAVGPVQMVNVGHDMFCPGIAMLPSGNIFIVGGSAGGDGAMASTFWNGNNFVGGPQLNTPRGYNSAVTLANGQVCCSHTPPHT